MTNTGMKTDAVPMAADEADMGQDVNLEKVIGAMLDPNEIQAENSDGYMKNEEVRKVLSEVFDLRNAVLQEYSRTSPNVDAEWEMFSRKVKRHSDRRRYYIGAIVGIAATLLLLLTIDLVREYRFKEGVTVLTANNLQKEIVLSTTNGKRVVLNASDENQLNAMGASLTHNGPTKLTYQQHLDKPEEIHTLTTPRGMDIRIDLSDGSKVWLNAESQLEYPVVFSGKERHVRLTGEAYFEVAKDKAHPFVVNTGDLQTRVLGTQFNIRNYSDRDAHVTLVEGSVEVKNVKAGKTARIKPGEDAQLQENGDLSVREVDVDPYVYWKEGYFYFDDEPLKEIMQSLGRWYNVNVVFHNRAAMDYKMHCLCDRKAGLDQTIMLLNHMRKIKLTLEGNTVYVR